MLMAKIALALVGVIVVGLALEVARMEWGVPITMVDLIFFPLLVVTFFNVLKGLFRKIYSKSPTTEGEIKKLSISLLFFSTIAIPFGAWSVWHVWSGTMGVFDYFPGGRGAAHGYTLISLGFMFLIMWVRVLFVMASNLVAHKRNDD
ncbi:hypothetical protein IEI94_05785 [Halomonas sp. ML-15]|uniref:hypothetical protein n=1 Tax=Halomonas sp. ML-15 TaxID=2773305 RepID=UPI001746BAC6|nr:hypothetical protein [Halomonas sp. ML-15]MBD3895357.1 hypothetical protein [Halomonas sp. ML-15]